MHSSNMIGVVIADVMNPFLQRSSKVFSWQRVRRGTESSCAIREIIRGRKRDIRILQSQFVEGIILGSSYVEDEW